MTLKKSREAWPHDVEKLRHVSLAGGPIMLKMGWPHDPEKLLARWPHEAANRQFETPAQEIFGPLLRKGSARERRRMSANVGT
jgi:hypothetical protein